MEMATGKKLVSCRGADCGAEFYWVGCRRRDGKLGRVPLNVGPVVVEDWNDPAQLKGTFVFIDADGDTVRASVPGDMGEFFVSHFATCPNAQDFRGNA